MQKYQTLIYRYFKYLDSLDNANRCSELMDSIKNNGYSEAYCKNIINRGHVLDSDSEEELELKLDIRGY